MDNEYISLLDYLKSECENDYKLLTVKKVIKDLNEKLSFSENLSEDKFRVMLKILDGGGYVDLKYFDEEVILIKPLLKSFLVFHERKTEIPQERVIIEEKPDFRQKFIPLILSFLSGFLGALLGGIIC